MQRVLQTAVQNGGSILPSGCRRLNAYPAIAAVYTTRAVLPQRS